jgi:hypothetical protein
MMIVRVQFVNHHATVAVNQPREQFFDGGIKRRMECERLLQHVSGQRVLPNRKSPGIGRGAIDGPFVGPVEIDFKSRSPGYHLGGRNCGPSGRKRIFLAKSVGRGNRKQRRDFLADFVSIVERYRDYVASAFDDFPRFACDVAPPSVKSDSTHDILRKSRREVTREGVIPGR